MAKDKVLIELLEEYKKIKGDKDDAFEYSIGCELHPFPYDTQLEFKKEHIKRLFAKKGFDIVPKKVYPSPIMSAYRNKMEYSFGDLELGGDLNLGLHVPGRYYDIESSTNLQIVDNDFNLLVSGVQDYCRNRHYQKFYKKDGTGLLRNFIVRKGYFTGEILIGISTSYAEFDEEDFVDFISSIELDGEVVGIMRLKNDSTADVVKSGDADKLLFGRDYYIEKILGKEFKVSFFSFFQTNSTCTEVLYTRVKENVRKIAPSRILDLFCGTGTISQILSDEAEELIGIEIVEDAVEMAKENAKINGIENCHYIAGDVFKVLKNKEELSLHLGEKTKEESNPLKSSEQKNSEKNIKDCPDRDKKGKDLIIVDPPRSGISKKALEQIISLGIDDILYVSCNPRTLVIDYEILNEAGYEIKHIEAVDEYPLTKHVECVVLLQREKR